MATEKNKNATEEKKFTISKLQEHCYALFGVPTSTFNGATAGLNGTYTVSEVKKIIEEWYKKEAK